MSDDVRHALKHLMSLAPDAWTDVDEIKDHIAALEADNETFRQRQTLWEDAATALYGYAEFIGPCVHGRDPWDRCDTCGEKNAVWAAQQVIIETGKEHRKALVRARNDGLEKAAVRMEQDGQHVDAKIIRAMKEPEE